MAHGLTFRELQFERLIESLRTAQLRITEPRKAILGILLDDHGPFTAEQIFQKIPKNVCDLATVYRSLGSLEEALVVKRCEFGDGSARYEISEAGSDHHHHMVCRGCRKVEILDICEFKEVDRFEERLSKKTGYGNISHSLEFFGVCPKCVKSLKSPKSSSA